MTDVRSATMGGELGEAVMDILGLHGRRVVHITIDIDVKEAARITVTELLMAGKEEAAVSVFQLASWEPAPKAGS